MWRSPMSGHIGPLWELDLAGAPYLGLLGDSLALQTADLPVVVPHRSPDTASIVKNCAVQPNHSFQAYAVSIEEVNVVGNTACKIRTVATVSRSMLTSIRADAVGYSNCGVPESPAEVACQSPARKWLLMAHELGNSEETQLTHEFPAARLGSHRSTAT